MGKIKLVLVPSDYSELADKAIAFAMDIARQENAKLLILHIVEVLQHCNDVYCLDAGLVADLEKKSVTQAQKMMKKQVAKFPGLKKLSFRTAIKTGYPYDGIMREIKANHVDLVVMGAHKKRGFIDRFLGSVADKVARGAKCPVLLIKS